jgi:hypothetical protein
MNGGLLVSQKIDNDQLGRHLAAARIEVKDGALRRRPDELK